MDTVSCPPLIFDNRGIFFRCGTLSNRVLHLLCRPSDSTVSEDAGIEPRTDATLELADRRSNYSAGTTYTVHNITFSGNLALCGAILNLRADEWRKVNWKMCVENWHRSRLWCSSTQLKTCILTDAGIIKYRYYLTSKKARSPVSFMSISGARATPRWPGSGAWPGDKLTLVEKEKKNSKI